jgi:hypothetical protein
MVTKEGFTSSGMVTKEGFILISMSSLPSTGKTVYRWDNDEFLKEY